MRFAATVTPLSLAETEHVVDPGRVTVPQFTVMSGVGGGGAAVTLTSTVAEPVTLPFDTVTFAIKTPDVG